MTEITINGYFGTNDGLLIREVSRRLCEGHEAIVGRILLHRDQLSLEYQLRLDASSVGDMSGLLTIIDCNRFYIERVELFLGNHKNTSCLYARWRRRVAVEGSLDAFWISGLVYASGFCRYLGKLFKFGDFSQGMYLAWKHALADEVPDR